MIGRTISHYRITSQLGSGGMGVVYAGEDPRLNRPVALKFVPEELANDAHTLERLRSEARTVSGLNHPNICTIYDVGEYDGRPFFVMELLKGQTLRERIGTRPLKVHDALEIGIQVSDALYWAHNKGVIHRDIKPANIFLTEQGQVKVLDFGLAKNIGPRASEATLAPTVDLTAVGVALGTVAYMSPEQVSGETLDARTDLFSLGVVLYECLTAQQPFHGKTSAVVLASILTQVPAAPMSLNAEIPPRLQEVINNCLEKDREMRYQDAASLRADLKRIKRDLESGALKTSGPVTSTVSIPSMPTGAYPVALPVGPATTGVPVVTTPSSSANRVTVGVGVVAVVAAAVAVTLLLSNRPATDRGPAADARPPAAESPQSVPSAAPPTRSPMDQARFDAAIVDANRLLASGDADGATRSLNVARAIDPGAREVADLSARLVQEFRNEADSARQGRGDPGARGQTPTRRPVPLEPAARPASPPVQVAAAAPSPQATPPPPAAAPTAPVPAEPQILATRPAPPEPPPAAATPEPTPTRTEPPAVDRRPPAAAPAAEDDDAAIRRVVSTYARAIENKDLTLFRSVKPNMSPDEQRRIEAGFRAVTSQRVTVTVQSIEHRGSDASVRISRHDVIQAGGRQQTADSQQSLTLIKGPAGWTIRDIGR